MNIELAERVKQLTPSPTLAITAKAKQLASEGHNVISLGAGEPDFNTPAHVIEAAYQAMLEGKTKYTPAGGVPELKQAIIAKLKKDQNLDYIPNQIIVGVGAKHLLYNLFQVLLNTDDEVIIPTPYWVSYPEQVKLAGGKPVYIEGKEENGFKITGDQLKNAITEKTKAIVINSPSNPTGAVYTKEELIEIADIAVNANLWIVSDEIYEKLIYEGEHYSIAALSPQFYERTIVINGLSKPYSMTGWRIGYAAGNEKIIAAMTDLSSHSISNPTSVSQYASIAALNGDQQILEDMKQEFKKRRDQIFSLINAIPGFSSMKPQGAFYYYINISKALEDAGYTDVDQWANDLLGEQKVAVISGSGFGTDQHIRISYATGLTELLEAINRIRNFVTKG